MRIQRGARRARAAPRIIPGKKPATTALLGKDGQVSFEEARGEEVAFMSRGAIGVVGAVDEVSVAVPVSDDRVVDAVAVSDSVDIADVVAEDTIDVAVAAVLLFNTQVPLLQVYPNGQHASPHIGSLSSNRVVIRGFFGNSEGSWRCTLQVTGLIYEQSCPLGQQMAELSSSKLIQVLDWGQQKLDGRLELPHFS